VYRKRIRAKLGPMRDVLRSLLALPLALLGSAAEAAELEVGAAAPAFELHGANGARYTLAEHKGERGVVIAWFPKAFTPG